MRSFNEAHQEVKKLVDKFEKNKNYFLSSEFQEAEARKDFIDLFFISLGWDVLHKTQENPYEQEVKVEKGVSIGKAQKRADYAFYIGPNFRDPKFFAEAKKPSQSLKNPDYYFQTIRYGWNAGNGIGVLTDFVELDILDCTKKPDINDVFGGHHKCFAYTDYHDEDKFKEIYFLISREAVANNSIERYVDNFPKPKGKAIQKGLFPGGFQSIDESFLEYIDDIRVTLAKSFKKNDKRLTSEELTEATQRTIDRLVFIRFLEDKLIEQTNYVSEFGNRYNAWTDFISVCRKLDAKYNGVVFKQHFIDDEKFRGPDPDEFHEVCSDVSHLNTPYDYNFIPIHILGSIYERFLGKVVHATEKIVTVDPKPEVRKAGGVYYTPRYIVDYIVKNSIGKCIERKTPGEISKMRFADIACGSGSFLISAFEFILDNHNKYFQANPDKAKKAGCIYRDGRWVMTIKQKQQLLLNNIYGVDIDQQAIEVTQLSLYLKLLEDETTATANEMMVLFHEKILPDLSKNIVCGNSLIGADISKQKDLIALDNGCLNSLDFNFEFPDIMKKGGFDAVIGNPPYVRVDTLEHQLKDFIVSNYISAKGKYDLYYLFIERAFGLINKNGMLGYIIPNRFTTSDSGYELRKRLLSFGHKITINSVSKIRVFKEAAIYPCILLIEGKTNNSTELIIQETLKIEDINLAKNQVKILKNEIDKLPNLIFPINSKRELLDIYFRLIEKCAFSEEILLIQEGLRIPGELEDNHGHYHIVKQYQFNRYSDIKEGSYITKSKLKKYISSSSSRFENCLKEKILFAEDALRIKATLDPTKSVCQGGVYFGTLIKGTNLNMKYLLGIYNSKLMTRLYENLFAGMHMGGGYLRFRTSFLNKLPIRIPNMENRTEKQTHDRIIQLVEHMVEIKGKLRAAKTDKDKNYWERKINEADMTLDNEIYSIYALTEKEIDQINNAKEES